MRILLSILLLGLAAPSVARACPRGTACFGTTMNAAVVEAPNRVAPIPPPVTAPVRAPLVKPLVMDESLTLALRAKQPAATDASAMPWIWQVLRTEVYEAMPHYEQERYSLTLTPVVVAGQFDTVPGLGVGGDF